MKANHNLFNIWFIFVVVVYQYVKDTKWKQITTLCELLPLLWRLFINMSKIQNESKSQHLIAVYLWLICCLSICQRYKMKANHNLLFDVVTCPQVVYQYVKDTKWKQITTVLAWFSIYNKLFINMSKIQNESKSQQSLVAILYIKSCLSICQRYKMKANHN